MVDGERLCDRGVGAGPSGPPKIHRRVRRDPFGAVRIGQAKGTLKRSLPVGTVTLRSDLVNGKRQLVRFIKVRLDGPPQHRWKLYARWWWEKNNGPVPEGKIVIHVDGNELNDKPENIALGTHGDVAVLHHMRNPEWSEAQHRRAGAGTAEFNRFSSKLNRLRKIFDGYWYPVLDQVGIIFNAPFRRRNKLLAWFGVDVSSYPRNGRARKLLASIDDSKPRAVRGRELAHGILKTYLRIDPEFVVNATGEKLSDEDEEWIKTVRDSETWRQAEAAAKSDLRERK